MSEVRPISSLAGWPPEVALDQKTLAVHISVVSR
jgi:hypothetical protein